MKNYIRNFRFYNKTNETGAAFVLVAFAAIAFIGIPVAVSAVATGTAVTFGAWVTLPLVFTALAVTHYALRPIVAGRMHGQK